MQLTADDRSLLGGEGGAGAALAMRILVRAGEVMGANDLIPVTSAHIDGCLYHGQASLDFVDRMVEGGARVRIPTTLNVGAIDLIHPELFRGTDFLRSAGRRLMEAHIAIGCEPTFTCAPYQRKQRPALGEQIAWAESNAIVFANSVLGARTNRYGDFIDLCAAIVGKVPNAGLHVTENRFGQVVFELPDVTTMRCGRDVYFALVGLVVGARTGSRIPVLVGLPLDTSEDELKALGAASASSGGVALFHAVGVTPEAPTLAHALGPHHAAPVERIGANELTAMRASLGDAREGDQVTAVSLGTPHFSLREFEQLFVQLDQHAGPLATDFYVNTSRHVLAALEEDGRRARLEARGVTIVVDTCTYLTPIMRNLSGVVMTNSGKMAHYAPSNLGVRLGYGSMEECVRSAVKGHVVFDA